MLNRRAFVAFANAFSEPLLLVADDGEILSVNRSAARLLGRQVKACPGLNLEQLSAPGEPSPRDLLRSLMRTRAPLPGVLSIVDAAGSVLRCRVEGSLVRHGGQGRRSVLLRLQPRQSAADRVAVFSRQVARLEQEVARRRQAELVLEGQKRLLEMIGGNEPLLSILGAVAHFVEEHSQRFLCAVLRVDEDGKRLRLAAAPSLPETYGADVGGHELASAANADGAAPFEGSGSSPGDETGLLGVSYRELAARHGLRTSWSRAVRSRSGEVMAVVAMHYREPASPSVNDLFLTELAADLVAIALDRERAEAALRKRAEELAEADRRKDRFLAMLSHELRNPLAPIVNTLEVMQARTGDDEELSDHVAKLRRQTVHLIRLVDDLLDISRISHGVIELQTESVELRQSVRLAAEGARALFADRDQTLRIAENGEPLWIEADSSRLQQVFTNLFTNAAKYTQTGGEIEISIGTQGSQAEVRIRDNGQGLTAQLASRIFEPFSQGAKSALDSREGLGLGLTLVQQLVEVHGGTVRASSEGPGRGSEFVVLLPLASPPETAEEAPASPGDDRAGLDILIVEDNRDSADALEVLLELWGHRTRAVYDGDSVLAAARAMAPDVILLDIDLPGRNGHDVARLLHREGIAGSGCLLVAMTGFGRKEDIRKSRSAGFDEHFVKPADPAKLRQLLADVAEARLVS